MASTLVDDYEYNLTIFHRYDVHYTVPHVIETITMVFMVLHIAIHIERAMHILNRLFLPARVQPTQDEVFLSIPCKLDYPFVAIQLPMMDEIECCESIIECACSLDWPKSRLYIQVLDDSMEKQTKVVLNRCVQRWTDLGVQINIFRRPYRHGFKAGNLIYGLSFIPHAEYVVIFDVDFLPTKDYLLRTLPILIRDSSIAFVQARWTFTNSKESFLTRMQEISLNFHHKCEQEGRFRASMFFGFNGTAGVWRASAIEQAGGWHMDTLVEDLDLSVRAYLNGWSSVYMHDLECLNEIPPTLSAYLSQQHRWMSGPMQVARKMIVTVWQSRHISWLKKLSCSCYLFRNFLHLFNLISLIVVMPSTIWTVQTNAYSLISITLIIIQNLSITMFTPDEMHLTLLYGLFMNVMSLNNACATISGLVGSSLSKQWIVTPKFGLQTESIYSTKNAIEKVLPTSKLTDNTSMILKEKNLNDSYFHRLSFRIYLIISRLRPTCQQILLKPRWPRFYKRNLSMAIYLLFISYLAFEKGKYVTGIYIFSTSIMCFIFAFGLIGRME